MPIGRGRVRGSVLRVPASMIVCLALGALASAAPSVASVRDLGVSIGASYSTGTYGGIEPINVGSTYLGINTTLAGWRVDATLPHLFISSGGAAVNLDGVVLPGVGGSKINGFGDLTIRAVRSLPLGGSAPFDLSVALQTKLPTGEAGLSTGKLDAGIDVELSKPLGIVSPFLNAGYRTYGDTAELELTDGWLASAGAAAGWGKTTMIVSYDWAESPIAGPATHEIFGVAAGELSKGWGWALFASKGLSSGAADYMLGAGITRSFGQARVKPKAPPRR